MTDPVERERRKARWETRFAGWLVENTPYAWTLTKQLVVWVSFALIVGAGSISLAFGLNLLLSAFTAILIAMIGLFLYRRAK
jgi:hypothetical protein